MEMGKFIVAHITYEGPIAVERLDLSLWEQDFFLRQGDSETISFESGNYESQTKVRLYPRQIGQFSLDAIAHGGAIAKPQQIQASPSIRNGINAKPTLNQLKAHYWTDENIFLSIDTQLHYAGNKVVADSWEQAGFEIYPLPTQTIIKDDITLKRLNWMVIAPSEGHYQIQLPAIEQRGKGRFRYYLPLVEVTIKPLPSYFPASISVGELTIKSELITHNPNKQLLKIEISKLGYLPSTLEGLHASLSNFINLEQHQIHQTKKLNNNLNINTYTVEMGEWNFGKKEKLNLKFFNPKTAQLETITHQLPSLWSIPQFAVILFLILIISSLVFLGLKAKPFLFNWKMYRIYIKQLKNSATSQQLRYKIVNSDDSKSLSEWANKKTHSNAQDIANKLNEACFSKLKYD